MDNHSKNVCLIGILYILGCILVSLTHISRVIRMLSPSQEGKLWLLRKIKNFLIEDFLFRTIHLW